MVKEKKIRKVFEEIYQEQLAKHRRGGTIQNLCRVIKTHCVFEWVFNFMDRDSAMV
jgi:hypothetical protein